MTNIRNEKAPNKRRIKYCFFDDLKYFYNAEYIQKDKENIWNLIAFSKC